MIAESLIQEFKSESATTRRVLERVPEDRLTWKPHTKSMSLGTLAMHIASGPALISSWALADSTSVAGLGPTPEPTSAAAVLAAHDEGVKQTVATLTTLGDGGLMKDWKLTAPDGSTIMGMPKIGLIRGIVLNHIYHHRGQLSVYLRLLDVPVPSIYGPSADEAPFRG